ncbi:ATP-binding cassette sub- G member 2 [Dinochytrium kinnereticum]|nr:ATP-binding cassette sub- G member 2 [Dinochytrium kinnereticum]
MSPTKRVHNIDISDQRHPAWKNELSWSNITYEIRGRRGEITRTLLRNVSGVVRSGEMVAIMGSSGAGKTTLLNCLSGRLSIGSLTGNILYNSYPRNPRIWRRITAFVEQDDVLYSQITVRETLRYAARLRLPSAEFSVTDKNSRADEILKSLRLGKAADTPIGNGTVRGVSGGERKRTAIGQELVGDPEILFLDEPTSGLDSNSALAVIETVKQDAAKTGRIVIATIHQPSFELLSCFDTIILLSGGSTIYMGSPLLAVDYFASLGYLLSRQNQNPADFFMDLMTIDFSKTDEEVKKDVQRIETLQKAFVGTGGVGGRGNDSSGLDSKWPTLQRNGGAGAKLKWANNWFMELGILLSRSWAQFIRGRSIMIALLVRTVILVVLIGFTFFQLKNDQKGIQNRIGILFFWPVNQVFNTIMPILGVFPLDREIMLRELLTETIPATTFTIAACTPLYFMMGLRMDDGGASFFRFLVIQWIEVMVCLAVGLAVGAAVPSVQLAQVVGPLFISPVNYAYRANMFNEYQGAVLTCPEDPALPCFRYGEQVLKQYSITSYSLWGCVGILAILFAAYLGIGYILLRVLGKPKVRLV